MLFISFTIFLCLYPSVQGEVNYCRNFSARLTWLHLDMFVGCGVLAETQMLSRFLLMTPSLLFTSSGSFLVFCFIRIGQNGFSTSVYHKVDDISFPVVLYTFPGRNVPIKMGYNVFISATYICKNLFRKGWFCGSCWEGFLPSC